MIKDFRIMPRDSGKITLILEAANTSNSLVVTPFLSRTLDMHREGATCCHAYYLQATLRGSSYTTIIFDDLFEMPFETQKIILNYLDYYDFYIYSTIRESSTSWHPELYKLIEQQYPEFLI